MYVIINNDLKMDKGKAIAQACHAVEIATEKLLTSMFESTGSDQQFIDYHKYKMSGRRKIVLKGTQSQLEEMSKQPDAVHVIDAGYTQVPENSLTAVAFYPSKNNKERFAGFKLLN